MPFINSTASGDVDYKDFGKDTWYLTYQTETSYQSSDPDQFIYNNPVRCYLTTDKYDYPILQKNLVIVPISDLTRLIGTNSNNGNTKKGITFTFPIDANGRVLKNSFDLDYPDITNKSKVSVDYDIIDINDNIIGNGSITINPINDKRANGYGLMVEVISLPETPNMPNSPLIETCKLTKIKIKRDNFMILQES